MRLAWFHIALSIDTSTMTDGQTDRVADHQQIGGLPSLNDTKCRK